MISSFTLQKIAPAQAKLCLQIKKFWNKQLIQNQQSQKNKILLALSGGADSTAMAVMLWLLQSQLNISLCAVTINHKLRADAKKDVLFVKELCGSLRIEIICREADVLNYAKKNKTGLEESGRLLRYKILEEVRVQTGSAYIALAHNADDLCEDVLMRLCRGVGWPGLGGMAAFDAQRKVLRPLLQIPRSEIEKFLTNLKIAWQTDTTNLDQNFTRNRFRQTITPKFQGENPNFNKAIHNLWEIARIDAQFWNDYLNDALSKAPWRETRTPAAHEICLSSKLLASIPKAARLRLLSKAVKVVKPVGNNMRADSLFSIEKTWLKGIGGKEFFLTNDLSISINKKNIYIRLYKRDMQS